MEIGLGQILGIITKQEVGRRQLMIINFAGRIMTGFKLRNARGINVKGNGPPNRGSKSHRDRQPDIPQTNNRNLASVAHCSTLEIKFMPDF